VNWPADLKAGFLHDDVFYSVRGWISYSKDPYRDDLMAGVRIYCRGKIAGQTHLFNLKAGFEGEYNIRSYLVGEMYADWLDEEEDLIQTDRRDILWSHELGEAFEKWGQDIVKAVGRIARDPMRKRSWETFQEVGNLDETIKNAFPAGQYNDIRKNARDLAKVMGQAMSAEELKDKAYVDQLVQLSISFAPHVTLTKELKEAAEKEDTPLSVVTSLLKTARIAELYSLGRIADQRIQVIERLEHLTEIEQRTERDFQKLIEQAPWLINPEWYSITENARFHTFKKEFERFFKEKTGKDITLPDPLMPNKQPDFILHRHGITIQIVEIKDAGHAFDDKDMERLSNYVKVMNAFLADPARDSFKELFGAYRITLVCDDVSLSPAFEIAYNGLCQDNKLERITWSSFLDKAKKSHEEWLDEATRQKQVVLPDGQ
jgi:hypothetical protein